MAVKTFLTGVAGEAQTNQNGSHRQSIIARCNDGYLVQLIREPNNPYDQNAIQVVSPHGQIGYIKSDVAKGLARDMDRGAIVNARIHKIKSGGDYNLGVVLSVTVSK